MTMNNTEINNLVHNRMDILRIILKIHTLEMQDAMNACAMGVPCGCYCSDVDMQMYIHILFINHIHSLTIIESLQSKLLLYYTQSMGMHSLVSDNHNII